jgi:hypothetical protein
MNQMLVRAASAAGQAGKGARQLQALPDILVDRELPD